MESNNVSNNVVNTQVDINGLDELRGLLDRLEAIKPGYKTTEFWVSLAVLGINIALTYGFLTNDEAGQLTTAAPVIANAVIVVGYALARARAKGLN